MTILLFPENFFRVIGFSLLQNLTFDLIYKFSSKNEIKEDHSKLSKVINLNLD